MNFRRPSLGRALVVCHKKLPGGVMKYAIIVLATCVVFQTLSAQNFWQHVNGPSGFAYFDLLASNSSGHIFAAYEHVFRSTDNGQNWTVVDSGLPASWFSTGIAISPAGDIFLGLVDRTASQGRLFRSTNNGDSWFASDSSLSSPWVFHLAFAPNGNIFLASGNDFPLSNHGLLSPTFGMFRSSDGGQTWEYVGLPSPFHIAITNSGVIFAGDRYGRFRSTDNGSTWQTLNLSTGGVGFTRNSSDHIFAFGATRTVRSKDDGTTWSEFCTLPVYAMAFSLGREAFVGNANGVFRSTNDGAAWSPINQGLTTTYVRSLEITANGYLFAATLSGGGGGVLFRSVSPVTDVGQEIADLPPAFALDQNYPNPSNPTTRIRFTLSSQERDGVRSHVSLRVYDILGREVRTLVNENLPAGSYEVTFNAAGLASGVYLYRLQSDRFAVTRKLILLH